LPLDGVFNPAKGLEFVICVRGFCYLPLNRSGSFTKVASR